MDQHLDASVYTHSEKPLQELLGAIEIYVGYMTVSSQHAVHRRRNILPIILGFAVKLGFVFHQLRRHYGLRSGGTRKESAFMDNKQVMEQFCVSK
ncbi:hypothetical protein XELAEV_18001960mg [Xenopus laevis]|uniref:Uncharacterized protein n=1 Tax=Xenopus laevis TaxID=8355 RepID=A0A974BP80_XENLA|nr:hypothetical protein XELAEV_18001960mg [Xenopus laevis]